MQAKQHQEPQHPTTKIEKIEIISQVQQQQLPTQSQQKQGKSSDSTIKRMDIYEMEETLEQSVISEIGGLIIKSDADYTNDKGMLDQEQMYDNNVEKFDTFRGGTEFKLYTPSTNVLQADDSKMMETIVFGAQTAKLFQNNGQYQVKDNSKSESKRKKQKSVKFQIEEDKVIEAHVTHWQELEKQDRVQQGQEIEEQDRNLSKYAVFIGEDHNFRHGAEKQIKPNTMLNERPTFSV